MTKTSTFAVARDEVKDLWVMIGGLDRQVKETQKIEKALKDSANSHTAALETKVSHASPNLQHISNFLINLSEFVSSLGNLKKIRNLNLYIAL